MSLPEPHQPPAAMEEVDVAIVGGGVSGLSLALALRKVLGPEARIKVDLGVYIDI